MLQHIARISADAAAEPNKEQQRLRRALEESRKTVERQVRHS